MPIRPENRKRYPSNWKQIRAEIMDRATGDDGKARCEGSPAFPDCDVVNHEPHPETGSNVVLTIAHLDHTPENCDPENLRAWCQRCHNTYDLPMRIANRRRREFREAGQTEMFAND